MTVLDHSLDDDERALAMHGATEAHIRALRIAFGLSRKAALEHIVAFAENDDEPVKYQTAPLKTRKRARRVQEQAAA